MNWKRWRIVVHEGLPFLVSVSDCPLAFQVKWIV